MRLKPPPGDSGSRNCSSQLQTCYWPGVTEADLETIARRAAPTGSVATREQVTYLGSLLFTRRRARALFLTDLRGRPSNGPADAPAFRLNA